MQNTSIKTYKLGLNIADFLINAIFEMYPGNRRPDYVKEAVEKPDFVFVLSNSDIEYEKDKTEEEFGIGQYGLSAIHRKIAEVLPTFNSFVLHSAVFDIAGTGVAFAAHSGTGKTTHMLLWQELLGDKMTVVNGDKPIIRFFDSVDNAPEGTKLGVPYAYGTPWNGKEHLGCNMRTELKHICFIERSEKNFVEQVNAGDIVNRIFNQVYMPKDPIAVANTVQLIDRMLNCCKLWIIHCNMDISAAETAYNAIFGEEK